MRRNWLAAAAALVLIAPTAVADEIGGTGFTVPQDEWLWGIEGLVRTPVDLAGDVGGAWYGYEGSGKLSATGGPFARTSSKSVEFDNTASIQGGLRIAGGIGYWSCCVLIEPAVGMWGNKPLGDEREPRGPTTVLPPIQFRSQIEIKESFDFGFGPQITWMIKDDTPLLSAVGLGGLPLVFFPFLGVAHSEYEVEFIVLHPASGTVFGTEDRNFQEEMFMVGFDLDIPLPGSHGPFTHALTFGFKWVESDEKHDMTPTIPGPLGDQRFEYSKTDGYRVELRYHVTWNDFEGFIKRNIFGPVN